MAEGKAFRTYELTPVEVPPEPPKASRTRVSQLQRQVYEAAGTPNTWIRIATYGSRTGAYQAKTRLDKKKWPWPVVVYAVPVRGDDGNMKSELYVKVLQREA